MSIHNNFGVVHNLKEISREREREIYDIFSDKFYQPNHKNFYLKVATSKIKCIALLFDNSGASLQLRLSTFLNICKNVK